MSDSDIRIVEISLPGNRPRPVPFRRDPHLSHDGHWSSDAVVAVRRGGGRTIYPTSIILSDAEVASGKVSLRPSGLGPFRDLPPIVVGWVDRPDIGWRGQFRPTADRINWAPDLVSVVQLNHSDPSQATATAAPSAPTTPTLLLGLFHRGRKTATPAPAPVTPKAKTPAATRTPLIQLSPVPDTVLSSGAITLHAYEPCTHKGRHGYTLPGDAREHEMCERCRQEESARAHCRHPRPTHDHSSGRAGDRVPLCADCGATLALTVCASHGPTRPLRASVPYTVGDLTITDLPDGGYFNDKAWSHIRTANGRQYGLQHHRGEWWAWTASQELLDHDRDRASLLAVIRRDTCEHPDAQSTHRHLFPSGVPACRDCGRILEASGVCTLSGCGHSEDEICRTCGQRCLTFEDELTGECSDCADTRALRSIRSRSMEMENSNYASAMAIGATRNGLDDFEARTEEEYHETHRPDPLDRAPDLELEPDDSEAERMAEMAVERYYENGGAAALAIAAEDDIERERELYDPGLSEMRAARESAEDLVTCLICDQPIGPGETISYTTAFNPVHAFACSPTLAKQLQANPGNEEIPGFASAPADPKGDDIPSFFAACLAPGCPLRGPRAHQNQYAEIERTAGRRAADDFDARHEAFMTCDDCGRTDGSHDSGVEH